MDNIQLKGYWWLPANESDQLPGVLSFTPEAGAVLELVGVFEKDKFKNISEHPEIILGISQTGKPVTLYRALQNSISWPVTGLGAVKYFAHVVFDGVHFETSDSIKFHKLLASYYDLDAWIDTYGFKIDLKFNDNGQGHQSVIKYKLPKSKKIVLDNGLNVGVTFSSHGPGWHRVQTEARITQDSFLFVESPDEERSFDELHKVLDRFAVLHQIASQRLVSPKAMSGYTNKNAHEIDKDKPIYHPEVDIYFQPIEVQTAQRQKIPQEMLFTYRDLRKRQIQNWFSTYEKHSAHIYLYRSLIYSSHSFIETRFLNIAQALESLHSLLFNNYYIPQKQFNSRKQSVISSAPAKLRNWLEETIGNSNYKRFKEKIAELLKKKMFLFTKVLSDPDDFAKRVRDTRNEFVHQRKQKKSFDIHSELHYATIILTYLFEAYILQLIGFSQKKVRKIYERRINEYLGWAKTF